MLIFAIDDERPLLTAAKRIIGQAVPEAEILTFSEAGKALDVITGQNLQPDIVFSDIEMPGISGLDFAVKLKTVSPNTNLVFVTGYSEYAVEAFKVRAHGYILKPLTVAAVQEELAAIPVTQVPEPASDKLEVHCFGYFEVFYQGKPVIFQRKQTKELLAFLIDREGAACTADDIAAGIWEDELDITPIKQRIRNLISDLKNTLEQIGMEKVLIRSHNQLAIRRDMVDCDYYKMLAGDMAYVNAFRGEYMTDYPWAELTAGKLYFKHSR